MPEEKETIQIFCKEALGDENGIIVSVPLSDIIVYTFDFSSAFLLVRIDQDVYLSLVEYYDDGIATAIRNVHKSNVMKAIFYKARSMMPII